MEEQTTTSIVGRFVGSLNNTIRKLLFRMISSGPIPQHMAFIMDGNRRFAKKWKLEEGAGHKAGFLALMSVLKYCCEAGVKYVTVYAFSLDNFNRRPDEVQYVMDLMQEKIEGFLKEVSLVNKYGVRVLFIGDLDRLYEPVRIAAEKAMQATAQNTNTYLLVCVAYTSSHEIPRAIYEACQEKSSEVRASNGDINENGNGNENGHINEKEKGKENGNENGHSDDKEKGKEKGNIGENGKENVDVNGNTEGDKSNTEEDGNGVIQLVDLEKHMYMGVVPDPDILVRSSGETRLSNFLLWQTTNTLLYAPKALWPEMGLKEVVWGILTFQRHYYYLEKKKKQA